MCADGAADDPQEAQAEGARAAAAHAVRWREELRIILQR